MRGILHGSAALASLAVAALLLFHTRISPEGRAILALFALSQVALFSASALYHSVPWGAVARGRMQRIDHSMIYVKIAGAVTPIVTVGLGPEGLRLLAAVWAIALVGVAQKIWLPGIPERASIPLQVLQACLVLPAIPGFAARLPGAALVLLATSAFCYALGASAFVAERPRLWPRLFSYHELFHVLVVGGSSLEVALAFTYVAPLL